jgi:hypothetical protein
MGQKASTQEIPLADKEALHEPAIRTRNQKGETCPLG